jgi:hypothetical protein
MRRRVLLTSAVLLVLTTAGILLALANADGANDPPLFVPWNRIGDIALGESKARVESEYGSEGGGYHIIQRYGGNLQGYYLLHGSKVTVTFYGGRVGELGFTTPYYRTKGGFGVGSRIPLGPCHITATSSCEHRWNGFIYNVRLRENPCNCWVKVGVGARSLPVTGANYLKPWFLIYLHRGQVAPLPLRAEVRRLTRSC